MSKQNDAESTAPIVSPATAALIDKGHTIDKTAQPATAITEDKRETARHEHTNNFTNRASGKSK